MRHPWSLSLIAALSLAACGGSATLPAASAPPASSASSAAAAKPASSAGAAAKPATSASAKPAASASGSGGLDALYQKAKGEGSVTWYDATATDVMAPLVQEFEKTYPGIKVAYTDSKPPDIFTQVRVQETAHNVSIDVADGAELNIPDTINENLPSTVDWASLGVPADLTINQQLVQEYSSVHVVIYNTQKVAAADVPKSWDDLLDPKWKGQLAVDGRATFMPQWVFDPSLGTDKAVAYAKKLAGQQPLFESANEAIVPKVVSGQVAIGTTVLSTTLAAQKKGAPIDIAVVNPTNIAPTYLYVPNGAPHPAAAQLLVAWMATPAAQKVMNANNNSLLAPKTNCPGNGSPVNDLLCQKKIEWYGPSSLQQLLDLPKFYQQVETALGTYTGK